jgi:hypothetical protein
VLAAACGRAPQVAEPVFAPALPGGWTLAASAEGDAAQAPEPLRTLGVRRVRTAAYAGPAKVRVTLYELGSEASAFEAEQEWRPQADSVAFHRDRHFAVIAWEGGTREAVTQFVREFEKRLTPSAGLRPVKMRKPATESAFA